MSTSRDSAASQGKSPVPSDPKEIEREITVRQARLAATVDELTTRLSPKVIAQRSSARAQDKAVSAVRAEDGSWRTERLAALAAAVVAVIAWMAWRKHQQPY